MIQDFEIHHLVPLLEAGYGEPIPKTGVKNEEKRKDHVRHSNMFQIHKHMTF